MSVCATCGSYYRLTHFHKDAVNCEECAYILPNSTGLDEESEFEIQQIVHPSCKTSAIRYDDDDLAEYQ